MEQYIPKSAVEKILRNLWKEDDGHNAEHRICYNKALQEVQCEIDTLEVKEVDLDFQRFAKEMDAIFALPSSETENTEEEPLNWEYAIAKHFFELETRQVVNESLIRKIVDLNNEAAKHYDAFIKKEREENGFSQLAIDLLVRNVDANKLRIQYIIENLKGRKGEEVCGLK